MAGTTVDSELNAERGQPCPRDRSFQARADKAVRAPQAPVDFRLAQFSDDPAIRGLLRRNPMPGAISLTFEREPSFFAATGLAGAADRTILAFDRERLVCLGRCSIRRRYVNGVAKQVGYLTDLRLDASVQGRFDILRRGYKFFQTLQDSKPADHYFTSIAADNERSLRFLERGVPGMPHYEFISNFFTLLLPVRRKLAARRRPPEITTVASGSEERLPEIVQFLNEQSKRYELAACWTTDDLLGLQHIGLPLSDLRLATDGTNVVGCAALWDQRNFKQTVIRGYPGRVLVARPWLNLAAKLFGTSRLPPIGATLAQAFLSPLAVTEGRDDILHTLLEQALQQAATRGLEFLTLGFGAGNWKLAFIRNHYRCREYQTRIYQVTWPETDLAPRHRSAGFQTCRADFQSANHPHSQSTSASSQPSPDRTIFPEVSLL